jgi:hypothetical protein
MAEIGLLTAVDGTAIVSIRKKVANQVATAVRRKALDLALLNVMGCIRVFFASSISFAEYLFCLLKLQSYLVLQLGI